MIGSVIRVHAVTAATVGAALARTGPAKRRRRGSRGTRNAQYDPASDEPPQTAAALTEVAA